MGQMMAYQRANSRQRGYTYQWEKARLAYLMQHPLCVMCLDVGRVATATVVDHIQPHKGDMSKFWDRENWQALCKPCHDRHKQSQDVNGSISGCGVDGVPFARKAEGRG
jgi:5-methylcytosine-specific restriction protein A